MKLTAYKTIVISASIGLVASLAVAQPTPTQPQAPVPPQPAAVAPQAASAPEQPSNDTKHPIVVRIDPARVLDSAGQPAGKIENLVLNPAGCTDAAIVTSDRGRLIPVPWQMVRPAGITRGAGQAPGTGLTFTIDASNDQITRAPSFARDQWPNVAGFSWLEPSISFFKSSTAAGGTSSSSTSSTGVGTSTNNFPFPAVAITNNPNANLPETGRTPGPNIAPVPPSIPPPVNPGAPISVPPTTPPGTLPPPVTPPPSTSVPPNTAPPPVIPAPGTPGSPNAGF